MCVVATSGVQLFCSFVRYVSCCVSCVAQYSYRAGLLLPKAFRRVENLEMLSGMQITLRLLLVPHEPSLRRKTHLRWDCVWCELQALWKLLLRIVRFILSTINTVSHGYSISKLLFLLVNIIIIYVLITDLTKIVCKNIKLY